MYIYDVVIPIIAWPKVEHVWRYKLAPDPTCMMGPHRPFSSVFILNSHLNYEWEIFRHGPFQKTTGRRLLHGLPLDVVDADIFLLYKVDL